MDLKTTRRRVPKKSNLQAESQEISTTSSIKKEFSEKELQDLRTAFELLDRNQDGIEIKEDVVEEIIRKASHQGKELIDENDFLTFVKQIQQLRPGLSEEDHQRDLKAAFQVFDMDNDGFITRDELRIAMEMIGETVTEEQLTQFIVIADTDKDGRINYEEFSKLLS